MVKYVQAVRRAMPRFNSQDYGIILNGLASLGVVPEELSPGFLDQLSDLAAPKLGRFNDQEVGAWVVGEGMEGQYVLLSIVY